MMFIWDGGSVFIRLEMDVRDRKIIYRVDNTFVTLRVGVVAYISCITPLVRGSNLTTVKC